MTKKVTKKQAEKTRLLKTSEYFSNRPYKFLFLLVAILSLGCMIGVFYIGFGSPPTDKRYAVATEKEKAAVRQHIIDKFMAKSTINCSDSVTQAEQEEVFKKYLKVNKYANRAVIRGCGDYDQLLARNSMGQWYETTVNMSLDKRANPFWQAECLVDDITATDTVIRPENTYIDASNYVECQRLNEHYFVKLLLTEGLRELGETPSDSDVIEYIKAIREL